MINNPLILIVSLLTSLLLTTTVSANDVDDADSLDFETFHTDKEKTVKTWQTNPKETFNNDQNIEIDVSNSLSISTQKNRHENNSNTFETRERYTLNNSLKTPYSAFYVIEALHKKMADLCPQGWEKTREWSIPVENDFYLYYQFNCL
jgi:hypothetical protein